MSGPPTHEPSEPHRWRIVACPGCARDLKLRSEIELSAAACPYCSAPLEGDPTPPVGERAPVGIADGDPGAMPPKQKRRRQHAGKQQGDPDWDREPGDGAVTDDDVSEYVEVDPNNPDALRVRRVRRKRTLTPAQKVNRALGLAFVGLAGLVGITILIIAIYKGADTVQKDAENTAVGQDETQKLLAAINAQDQFDMVVDDEERAASKAVIEGFLAADSQEERLKFVRSPERVAPLMGEWYAGGAPQRQEIAEFIFSKKERIDGRYWILLAAKLTPSEQIQFFTLEQTEGAILMDWETSSGYQPMRAEDLRTQRPTSPVPLRVNVELSDFYDGERFSPSEHLCCRLTYPGDPDFEFYGYAPLDSPIGTELRRILEIMRPAWILEIRYPEAATHPKQVEITGIVNRNWFLD